MDRTLNDTVDDNNLQYRSDYNRPSHVMLDHIRCELIAKRVSGETPGGIFT